MKNLKVVLVDDNEMVLKSMMLFLNYYFIVKTCKTHIEAIDFVKNNEVDIIITDQYLRDYEGINLVNDIKKINPNVISVVITGYPNLQLKQKIMSEDIDLFFTKPIIFHTFINNIIKVVQKKIKEVV